MKSLRQIGLIAACAGIAVVPVSAFAQRQAPSPEQRIERLERQVQQMQRQVFPKGRPADTAGFSEEPAATQSAVVTLDQRLDALERQMSDLVRQSEVSSHSLQTIEGDIAKLRSDQDQRINAIEQRINEAASVPTTALPSASNPPAPALKPKPDSQGIAATSATGSPDSAGPASDPGEDAYSQGFHLWEAGQYDQAITTLKAFTSAYPKHRRISFANNLIGRAQLDKGDARAAAQTLLANYRSNPRGERAPDSLYYLGQALLKLGQPSQACKAYAELESVYGSSMRADLKKLVAPAKTEAQCS